MKLLSRLEEIILLSIWRLAGNAYGITIHEELVRVTGKKWPLGAIYAPLERLRKNKYVQTAASEPTAERGGRHKILYRLTPSGKSALAEIRKVSARAWAGLPAGKLEKS